MIPRVVAATPSAEFRLWIEFQDGSCGEIDLEAELWGEMFEPLKDPDLFLQAMVDPEMNTVTWPNGADFAPEFLYRMIQQSVESREDSAIRP